MDYLEILDRRGERRVVPLDRPRFLIGRETGCDVCLAHANVSRRHAQLQRTEQGLWLLQDLNSLNHTYVNDEPIQQVVLLPRMMVRIADYRLALLSPPGDVASPPTDTTLEAGDLPSWPGLEAGWLERLQTFQRDLLHLDDPRQVLERTAREFQAVASPREVAIGLAGPDGHTWEVVLGEGETAFAAMADAIRPRVKTEDSDVQCWQEALASREAMPTTLVCLLFPMKGRAGVIGHVFLQQPRSGAMPASLQRYLTLFATHAGLVWENLQVATLRLAQRAFEQELERARQIQTDLFPPTFDVDPRLGAYAVNLPSVRVSGDYYDLFRTGPDTIAFVVADAMGHGMPAALLMAAIRAALRLGLKHGLAWDHLWRGLDDVIAQAKVNSFVTGLVGEINLARGELALVSAGHDPPSILVDGRPVTPPACCQTRPWGLEFEVPWEVGRVSLGDGDWSILCCTDGVYQGINHPRYGWGAQCIAAYHLENGRLGAEDLCMGLLNSLAPSDRSDPLMDDQTVLALRSARRG
jgi:serine phosphatase RsbU (regulator of sigma subunit)/pSer/pThr/pTyr-binding forkhead associated (FHA) protein